jgi:hypothetical protein
MQKLQEQNSFQNYILIAILQTEHFANIQYHLSS